jgi:hypothetical protein
VQRQRQQQLQQQRHAALKPKVVQRQAREGLDAKCVGIDQQASQALAVDGELSGLRTDWREVISSSPYQTTLLLQAMEGAHFQATV